MGLVMIISALFPVQWIRSRPQHPWALPKIVAAVSASAEAFSNGTGHDIINFMLPDGDEPGL
jgi:hypothetical protein